MARYSKRAYTEIAEGLKELYDTYDELGVAPGREAVTAFLANLFERDNREFDRERFYKAVGIESIPMEEETENHEATS